MHFRRTLTYVMTSAALVGFIGFCHERVGDLVHRVQAKSAPSGSLPTADALRLCSLGYDQLVADIYWLSFVQYVGDSEERARDNYGSADKYIDLISGLDPHFLKAYWFAAFVVGNDARQPKRAAQLIERGIEANPNDWSLPFIAGINQYLYAHDEAAAARYYRMAAKFPEAPKWLGRQAAILEARIPSTIKEINTWDSIYHSSRDSLVKAHARSKLMALWHAVLNSATTNSIKNKARAALGELEDDS